MFGLTVRELHGVLDEPPFLDRILTGGPNDARVPEPPLDLRDYVELSLMSGFPQPALSLSRTGRTRWLDSYVTQLITRDVALLDGGRDPDRLRRYLEVLALGTAGIVEEKTLYEGAGITRKTGQAYERLLRDLFVLDLVPAWAPNRLKRLVRRPKRYLVDPGLVVGLLRLDSTAVMRDGDLLGRLLDTFVAAQLRAELPLSSRLPRLYHLRTEQGRQEVDLLAEFGAHEVVGVEVEASAAPDRASARHLIWLRELLGERFGAGVVFHTGPRAYELDERIYAVPIGALWA
jgi:hypothetical protein